MSNAPAEQHSWVLFKRQLRPLKITNKRTRFSYCFGYTTFNYRGKIAMYEWVM